MKGKLQHKNSQWIVSYRLQDDPQQVTRETSVHPSEKNDLIRWLKLKNKQINFELVDGYAKIVEPLTWQDIIQDVLENHRSEIITGDDIFRIITKKYNPPTLK